MKRLSIRPCLRRLAWRRRSERLPSAAGLRRARRIAGATASWRRCAKRRTGLPGSSTDETFVLESRKGERKLDRKPRGAAASTRPLARAGAGSGRRRSRRRDPQPHLARPQRKEREGGAGAGRDALLVSDAQIAAALDIPHEATAAGASASPHIQTGQQPPQPDQRGFRGIATKFDRVPSHRTRRPAIAQSVSRGGNGQTTPTLR